MRRLLVIACSEKKLAARGLLPAIERYDGPAFRVLRKYLREDPEDVPSVLILSAKYGLIAANRPIPAYDRRLTPTAARELRPQLAEALRAALRGKEWRSVGICAGRAYRAALEDVSELVPEGVRVDQIVGGQGQRLTALREWLRGE
jgi:hypothetical protein